MLIEEYQLNAKFPNSNLVKTVVGKKGGNVLYLSKALCVRKINPTGVNLLKRLEYLILFMYNFDWDWENASLELQKTYLLRTFCTSSDFPYVIKG